MRRAFEAPPNEIPVIPALASTASALNATLAVRRFDVMKRVAEAAIRSCDLDDVREVAFVEAGGVRLCDASLALAMKQLAMELNRCCWCSAGETTLLAHDLGMAAPVRFCIRDRARFRDFIDEMADQVVTEEPFSNRMIGGRKQSHDLVLNRFTPSLLRFHAPAYCWRRTGRPNLPDLAVAL